jgi:hypothetical protein
MALYGEARDISMFRYINRELMGNIISQECVYYKYKLAETKVNLYGEATEGRYFLPPVILNSLIDRNDQTSPIQDENVGFAWNITFKFLRDDLVDANVVPEVGDIIMYQDGYWEVDNTNANKFFTGKDPQYPYYDDTNNNPLNPGLENFGWNVAVECVAHYVPGDRVNIQIARL